MQGAARAGVESGTASPLGEPVGTAVEERWELFLVEEDRDGGAPALQAPRGGRAEPLPRYGRVPVPAHLQSWLSAGPGAPPRVATDGIAGALAEFFVALERARQHLKAHRIPRVAPARAPAVRPPSVGALTALTTGPRPAVQRRAQP
jgi:hypothetical protein